jgi:hypothetical protein
MPMNVLVLESEVGAAEVAIAQLRRSGHEVHRCHESGERGFECAALHGESCPLDEQPIDVVLDVRTRSSRFPTMLEDGVSCALRRHLPVVVSGHTSTHPFTSFPVVEGGRDIVDTCERAAVGPMAGHEGIAQRALDETVQRTLPEAEASRADVRRRAGGLAVTLRFPPTTPARVRAMASVRVAGALRAFDRSARGIDVAWCDDDQE